MGARLFLAVVAVVLTGPRPVASQNPEEPLVKRGVVRLDISPTRYWWDSRFGERLEGGVQVTEEEPLSFDLTREVVGAEMIPTLSDFEARVAQVLQVEDFALDLGLTRATWTYSQTRIPIRLDVGITDWLTVSGTVPMVRSEALIDVSFQGDTLVANSGYNPARDEPGAVNEFLTALGADLLAFEGTVTGICTDLGTEAPECLEAQSLLAEGMNLDSGLEGLYLDSDAFFPLAGTDAGRILTNRVDALRSNLEGFGQTPAFGDAPLSAAPLNDEGFNELVEQPQYGVVGAPLIPVVGSWGLGDVEAGITARLLHRGAEPDAVDPGLQYTLGGEARLRFATGTVTDPDVFQSLPSGGRSGLRLRMFGSAQTGTRWGLWGHVAFDLPQPVDVIRRVSPPDVVLAPFDSRASVQWTPGNTIDVYAAPRFFLAEGLMLSLPYRFVSKGSDSFEPIVPASEEPGGGPAPPDLSVLSEETSVTLHRLGLGVTFSTLAAFRRDESNFPLELRATWQRAVAGGGGRTPVLNSFQASLRLFLSFWGDGA